MVAAAAAAAATEVAAATAIDALPPPLTRNVVEATETTATAEVVAATRIVVEDMAMIVAVVMTAVEDTEMIATVMIAVEATETVAVDTIALLATTIALRTYFNTFYQRIPITKGIGATFDLFSFLDFFDPPLTLYFPLCLLFYSPQQSEFALVVDGLGARPDWRDVKDHFRPMGANGHVAIRPNGQAIVPFDSEEALLSALKQAEGTSIRGTAITVTRQVREPREPRDAPSSSDHHGSPAARDAPESPTAH